jgi:calcineurin-like phosphoesterase family protein
MPAERLVDHDAHWYYVADPHFGHDKIRAYCDRPFADVSVMDLTILTALREVEEADPCARFIFAGDVAYNLSAIVAKYGWLARPMDHVCVPGNHDRVTKYPDAYAACFGRVVATEKTWASHSLLVEDQLEGAPCSVLVSHAPLANLQGARYNVYGHYHDNLIANPGAHDLVALAWLLASSAHLNAGVELNAYRPQRLAALVAAQGQSTLQMRIPDLTARRGS